MHCPTSSRDGASGPIYFAVSTKEWSREVDVEISLGQFELKINILKRISKIVRTAMIF